MDASTQPLPALLSRSSYSLSDPSAAPFVTPSPMPVTKRLSSASCPSLESDRSPRSSDDSSVSEPPSVSNDAFLSASSKDLEPPLDQTLFNPTITRHAPRLPLPPGSWDTHIHVIAPGYPLSEAASYKPHTALLPEARRFESSLGISNVVVVQPSVYGNDNSCTLAALQALGCKQARAVVVFDPDTIDRGCLVDWHFKGVRGVRVNMVSGKPARTEAEFQTEIKKYADIIRPFGWIMQLFIPMPLVPLVETLAPELDITVLLDHFGGPIFPQEKPDGGFVELSEVTGFQSLLRLLSNHRAYVKFSALYRCAYTPHELHLLERMAKEILKVTPRRVIWGSDWPHTRFEETDIVPFMEKCIQWCDGNEGVVDRLFARNAADLFQVGSSTAGESPEDAEKMGLP